jgi:hypothetical protein
MLGNEEHVESFETDVLRDRCGVVGSRCRCIGIDASLSLSLSLYPRFNPCNGAVFGALHDRLAGPRRAPLGRGISIAWRRPAPARQLARARVCIDLGRSPVNPWGTVKGAETGPSPVWLPWRCRPFPCGLVASVQSPACAPTRAGACSAERRGFDPRPRRSLFLTVCVQGGEGQAGQGRTERRVLCTRAREDAEMRRPSPSWGGGSR